MRNARALATAAAVLAILTLPEAPAYADGVPPQPFYADSTSSFDTCPHGYTRGTLFWRMPGPRPAIAVNVSGVVVDRPATNDAKDCANDGYSSTAVFTAYSGSVIVGSAAVTADNGEKQMSFTLGSNSTVSSLTQLVVQVCRDPVLTLPPSYCGPAVTYRP
jgi:hypothetical protein